MTPTRTRIGTLGVVFGAGFVVVLTHLWLLMVSDHDLWARRSHENRYAFKAVPGQRGALRDRFGRVLAYDEPTTDLALHYLRFRLRHPVGAAVHGATAWSRLQSASDGRVYDYLDGALGPEAAVRDLLAMPARLLRPRALPKDVASELADAVTTVLAGCSGASRKETFAALRRAADDGDERAVGDVLTMPRERLLAAFADRLQALLQLDREVLANQAALLGRAATVDDEDGLVRALEDLRRKSLADERITWVEDGKTVQGSKVEEVRRVFGKHVSFDLAAQLRVAGDRFAGIDVLPAVARRRSVEEGTSLHVLLGNVVAVDRTAPPKSMQAPTDPEDAEALAAYRRFLADQAAFERFLSRELPSDWLGELESPEEGATDSEQLQSEARERYTRELLVRGRRGVTGFERAFDDALMGRLGLRLVEHDAKRREQQLWSHLRVEAGEDVQVTIDVDLQRAAEAATRAAWQRELFGDEVDRQKTEAAIAVIDAASGDVLAYAGAPIVSSNARDVPGVVWLGNGSIGSVVKPFVLVEQLQSEQAGRPHRPLASFDPCSRKIVYQHSQFLCDSAHWGEGQDAVTALAKSCNCFFYQCGIGLGDAGIARSLQRFGLAPSTADDAFAACWQPTVRGIPVAPPDRQTRGVHLPQGAIGYGVAASPLHVARAYAAFATGWLPTIGLERTPRPRVVLHDIASEMARTELGLRECLQTGTGKALHVLADLGACGKTGTAEIGGNDQNNAWFAGYLPPLGNAGTQLAFCAVVYWVQNGTHGAEAAGKLVEDLMRAMQADPQLFARYLAPGGGR